MKNASAMQLHRFHDAAAVYIRTADGEGQTAYLSVEQTRAMIAGLERIAADIEARRFTDSTCGTVYVDRTAAEDSEIPLGLYALAVLREEDSTPTRRLAKIAARAEALGLGRAAIRREGPDSPWTASEDS